MKVLPRPMPVTVEPVALAISLSSLVVMPNAHPAGNETYEMVPTAITPGVNVRVGDAGQTKGVGAGGGVGVGQGTGAVGGPQTGTEEGDRLGMTDWAFLSSIHFCLISLLVPHWVAEIAI